ncbi:PIF-4/ODV-E28 [Macrobrachium rosenbergii nudivirus]|nr:PIF-4/ODV-E28 [Macrobrachium rosenbergii nudivirus]
MFTTEDYIIIAGSFVLIVIILLIIFTNNPHIIEKQVEQASENTQYKPTSFVIYDKSTADVCDRLVIVEPFQWHILATNGEVFLLNESNTTCPINYTPVLLTPHNKDDDITKQVFSDVCINRVFNEMVNAYTDNIIPKKIFFEIEDLQAKKDKFTILDCLNFLFKNYITMDKQETTGINNIYKGQIPIHSIILNDRIAVDTNVTSDVILNRKLQKVYNNKKLNKS